MQAAGKKGSVIFFFCLRAFKKLRDHTTKFSLRAVGQQVFLSQLLFQSWSGSSHPSISSLTKTLFCFSSRSMCSRNRDETASDPHAEHPSQQENAAEGQRNVASSATSQFTVGSLQTHRSHLPLCKCALPSAKRLSEQLPARTRAHGANSTIGTWWHWQQLVNGRQGTQPQTVAAPSSLLQISSGGKWEG